MNRRFLTVGLAAALLLGLAPDRLEAQRISGWGPVAEVGGRQFNIQLLRPWGGPVIPIFEGWYQNQEGNYELSFGYFNINTEEAIEIPLGPDNFIEPHEFDGLQPTFFLPVPPGQRRHLGVFTVTVPADHGARDVVWTLRVNGETYSVPGRLTHSPFRLEGWEQEGRQTAAPLLRFDPGGLVGRGPAGIRNDLVPALVGVPVPLDVWVARDNPFREDRRPVNLRWYRHQGPAEVVFSEVEQRVDLDGDGRATTLATFSEPGEYVLRVLAWNVFSDYEFHCCWTNGFVHVIVE